MKTTHYVYKITCNTPIDSRRYYIGVRSCTLENPKHDTNYWGSSKPLKEAIDEIGQENFTKEILSTWETREEANDEEYRLHTKFNVAKNKSFFNKAISNGKEFCTVGFVMVIDIRSGETKNVSKYEFEQFDFYKAVNKNLILVTEKKSGKAMKITKEEFSNNKECYNTHRKNVLTVIDTRTNKKKTVSSEEFKKHNYYVNLKAKNIAIFNKDDVMVMNCYGNFKDFCKTHNLLFDALTESYRNGGTKIYMKITDIGKRRLERSGRDHQIGWSAKILD